MTFKMFRIFLLFTAVVLSALTLYAYPVNADELQTIPLPGNNRVVDTTKTLSSQQVIDLNHRLLQVDKQSKIQIGIIIVNTTAPEDTMGYAQRVFTTWKIGDKKTDNGLLILVAKNDHKSRIHTGYGVEGYIPDAVAKRITADIMNPQFKNNHFYEGLVGAIDDITKRANVENKTTSTDTQKKDDIKLTDKQIETLILWVVIIVIVMFLLLLVGIDLFSPLLELVFVILSLGLGGGGGGGGFGGGDSGGGGSD